MDKEAAAADAKMVEERFKARLSSLSDRASGFGCQRQGLEADQEAIPQRRGSCSGKTVPLRDKDHRNSYSGSHAWCAAGCHLIHTI